MFYDKFVMLCKKQGVSRTKACIDCGVSRTAWHKWENGTVPNGTTINKLAKYFGISVGYLLGEEKSPTPEGEREVTLDDFTYAMQEETKYLTDMDRQILLSMARQLSKKARQQSNGESE